MKDVDVCGGYVVVYVFCCIEDVRLYMCFVVLGMCVFCCVVMYGGTCVLCGVYLMLWCVWML